MAGNVEILSLRMTDRLPGSFSFGRRRIQLRDLTKTVGFGVMRARNEGAADLGRVPAGDHAETQRFFGQDVTGAEPAQ